MDTPALARASLDIFDYRKEEACVPLGRGSRFAVPFETLAPILAHGLQHREAGRSCHLFPLLLRGLPGWQESFFLKDADLAIPVSADPATRLPWSEGAKVARGANLGAVPTAGYDRQLGGDYR